MRPWFRASTPKKTLGRILLFGRVRYAGHYTLLIAESRPCIDYNDGMKSGSIKMFVVRLWSDFAVAVGF